MFNCICILSKVNGRNFESLNVSATRYSGSVAERLDHGTMIRRPPTEIPPWPLGGFVLSSSEFKSMATLVKKPTGSPPTSWDSYPCYVPFKFFVSSSLKNGIRGEDK